ncbi:ferritin heavy chain [Paragonimus westermani]|uniref:Ferritin n=1 Tax=Paragonimus westermani TaxID=34504 RepID=A0A5J4N587_9TREM|nr:ferritin heavy chain [Paragonimus westermani]
MHSARINFTPESEHSINKVIELHKQAAHTYDHLAATCATEEISMPGFCKFFRLCSQRQHRLAEHWINFQTMRGGKVHVPEVTPLEHCSEHSRKELEKIVLVGLETEKKVEHYLREMHKIARSKEDVAMGEYIEKKLMLPQLHVIKMMANHTNGLRVSGNEYLYDRTTMLPLVKKLRRELTRWEEREGCEKCGIQVRPRTSTGVAAFIYPF